MRLIAALLISFILALISIPWFRKIAFKIGIIDRPDYKLKKHQHATAYLGGVAIFFVINLALIAVSECFFFDLKILLSGALIILMVGLLDDMFSLGPIVKLFGQIVAVLFLFYKGFFSKTFFLSPVGLFMMFIWLIGIINSFNLIDIMDGLAVTVGICTTISLIIYHSWLSQGEWLLFLYVFLGAQLAFLFYNRPRAVIYLGDAGSLLVGLVLGSIALKTNWSTFLYKDQPAFNCLAACLFASTAIIIPILETISLIVIRSLNGIPFYKGSHHHFIHFLRSKNWKDFEILLLVFGYALIFLSITIATFLLKITLKTYLLLIFLQLSAWFKVVYF